MRGIQKQIVEPDKVTPQGRLSVCIFEQTYLLLGEIVDVVQIVRRSVQQRTVVVVKAIGKFGDGDDTRFGGGPF